MVVDGISSTSTIISISTNWPVKIIIYGGKSHITHRLSPELDIAVNLSACLGLLPVNLSFWIGT